jgi:menaquinone-dependent protoporphyrinogen oxidase
MSRFLVLFASHFGQTRRIAERIAEHLRELRHKVDLVDVRHESRGMPSPQDYDAVVLGSRVELGRHAPELYGYISAQVDALRELPTAFFSVSMAAARPSASADPNGYMDTMFGELGWRPARAVAFAGGLPYRKYGWLLRFIMKRISRSAGHTTDTSRDHEFTDWARVERFADEIAAMVPQDRAVSWM